MEKNKTKKNIFEISVNNLFKIGSVLAVMSALSLGLYDFYIGHINAKNIPLHISEWENDKIDIQRQLDSLCKELQLERKRNNESVEVLRAELEPHAEFNYIELANEGDSWYYTVYKNPFGDMKVLYKANYRKRLGIYEYVDFDRKVHKIK